MQTHPALWQSVDGLKKIGWLDEEKMEGEKREKRPHTVRKQTELLDTEGEGLRLEDKQCQSEWDTKEEVGGETEFSLVSNRWLVLLVEAAPLSAVSTHSTGKTLHGLVTRRLYLIITNKELAKFW